MGSWGNHSSDNKSSHQLKEKFNTIITVVIIAIKIFRPFYKSFEFMIWSHSTNYRTCGSLKCLEYYDVALPSLEMCPTPGMLERRWLPNSETLENTFPHPSQVHV